MTHFSFLVIAFLLCATSTCAINVVDEDTICKKSKNPSFCSALLKSKPGPSKDLVSLAQYTLEVVLANITNTSDLIKKLLAHSGNNYAERHYFIVCLNHFGEHQALAMVWEAQHYLKIGDYGSVGSATDGILLDVDDCLTGESPSDPPYHDTSILPKYAQVVNQVVDIIDTIMSFF